MQTLQEWGLFRDGINPVARSNLVPTVQPPARAGVHARSYTVPAAQGQSGFIVAGSGEVPEGRPNYRDHIVAKGDTSPAGMQQKVHWLLGEQGRRLAALGRSWGEVTATQVYTEHDVLGLVTRELRARGAAGSDMVWHPIRPPIVDLDFETDCRGVRLERVI